MPANPFAVQVVVESPPRGPREQLPASFTPCKTTISKSWGLQPATALIDWRSASAQEAIVPMAQMTINMGGHTFHGCAQEVTPVLGADGSSMLQQFLDMRLFLTWDPVFGLFNKRDNRMVNGRFQKRYYHILPNDFDAGRKTYTNTPLTAVQILDYLFNAPTVESPWARLYHFSLLAPVYNVDCMSGKSLGQAVLEVSERLGTVFTLQGGPYNLVWVLKGVGTLPAFPANAMNCRGPGETMSGNPSRVTILGDRSVYQVLNIVMEPDWKPAYEAFFDVDLLAQDIFDHERLEAAQSGIAFGTRYNAIAADPDKLIGHQLAKARALTITVADYASLRDARGGGDNFRDYRKFAGKSRMQMPVALYIRTILFRAFRPPASFTFKNVNGKFVDLFSAELVDRALVEVTHDPVTGEMSWSQDVLSATNGYAIVQGYQVGQDSFKTLRPENFKLDQWVNSQFIWQHVEFQIDDSGEGSQFIVFDEPVIRTTDMMTTVDTYPVLKTGPTITAAPVRAALVFAAERYAIHFGSGSKDAVENVEGLNGEFVCYNKTSVPTELAYADGLRASEKASEIAAVLLNRQFYYATGGYTVAGSNATQLSAVIDRVTVECSGEDGMTETVDFTNERTRPVDGAGNLILEPERDFDRRANLQALLPGQRELKNEANGFRLLAAGLRQNPRFLKTLRDAFYDLLGYDERPGTVHIDATATGASLPVGTPLWRDSANKLPTAPGPAAAVTNPVFVGVTVIHNEANNGPVRVTSSGVDGVALVRVKGPVAVDDIVGFDNAGNFADTFLKKDGVPAVGMTLESIATAVTKLIRVRMGSGKGAGGGVNWRDEYSSTATYQKHDMMYIATGNAQGIWISVSDTALTDVPPVWPEPARVTPPGVTKWKLITFGVQITTACQGGNKFIYINSTPPLTPP